jgi:hypothetical protein
MGDRSGEELRHPVDKGDLPTVLPSTSGWNETCYDIRGYEKAGRIGHIAMKNGTTGLLHLFTSLGLSLSAAIALTKGAVYLDLRETMSLALPIIPVLFPLFYGVLRRNADSTTAAGRTSTRSSFFGKHLSVRFSEMRSLRRVLTAVTLSLTLKFVMEGLFLYTYYRRSGLPFQVLFGRWEDHLIGRFFRGDLLVVTASQAAALLLIEALLLTAVGGLWIGVTSTNSANAILEGLVAGTILAFFATLTNLSLLYARAESIATAAASVFSADYSQAFVLAGPLFQVFLYGCWTLVGQRCRRDLSTRSAAKSRRPSPSRSR